MGKNLAALIKEHRLKAGMSQGDLATQTGFTQPQIISNIERGLQGVARHRIQEFSEVLHVGPSRIIDAMTEDYRDYLNTEAGISSSEKDN